MDEILEAFRRTLKRNAGRQVCRLSELPYPKETIRQALHRDPGNLSTEEIEFRKTALLELQTFVADEDAELVQSYLMKSKPVSVSDIVRAQAVLEKVREAQAELIHWMREGTGSVLGEVITLRSNPVIVGSARVSLDEVKEYKEDQVLAYLFCSIGLTLSAFMAGVHKARGGSLPWLWLYALLALAYGTLTLQVRNWILRFVARKRGVGIRPSLEWLDLTLMILVWILFLLLTFHFLVGWGPM